jgi:hypothetical protein
MMRESTFPNQCFLTLLEEDIMHAYPTLPGSYAENQQALLEQLSLTDPSQAPFARIPCFMAYTEETKRTWTPDPVHILTPESEETESAWLCLAFSVVALHHWGEWPERAQPDCFGRLEEWRCEIDDEDIGFLSQFFAEAWETLREQHLSIRNLVERGCLFLENRFDMETEDGLVRLTTWLRWIVEALWENRDSGCSTETDADVRALRLIINLLGEGTLRVIENCELTLWIRTWILRAIHLIRNTGILPRQTYAVMTSYSPGNGIMGPASRTTTSRHSSRGFTSFAPKFDEWGAEHFQVQGLQVGFHTYIHPGAYIGRDVTIGHGAVIEAGASIGYGASIGNQAYIGVGAYVGDNANIDIGVKLLDAKPGQSPVIIGNRVYLEPGIIIFPDTPVIPNGTTLQSGIILRPDSVFHDPDGMIVAHPPSNSSIGPGNTLNTLIVRLAE